MLKTVNDRAQFAKSIYNKYKSNVTQRGQRCVVPYSNIINHKGLQFTVLQL